MARTQRENINSAPLAIAKEWRIIAVLLLIAIAVTGRGLWTCELPAGHDSLEYPARLVEFMENIKAGILFPRWAPDFSNGYGQPFFIYNPPLAYYIAGFFNLLGFSLAASWNAMCLVVIALSALFMYLFSRIYFPPSGSFLSSLLYVFAPYFLCDLYVRTAFAEYLAFAWIPLILLTIHQAFKSNKWAAIVPVAIGITALMLTHNPAALVIFPMVLGYAVTLFFSERNIKGLFLSIAGIILGFCLSAYQFLASLLENDLIQVAQLRSDSILAYTNHFLYAQQWFIPNWKYGLSVAGVDDGMPFQLGALHILAAVAGSLFLIFKRKDKNLRIVLSYFWAVVLVWLFMTHHASQFIWVRLPLIQYLQFSWRFLLVPAFGIAFLGAGIAALIESFSIKRILLVLFVALLVSQTFPHARHSRYYLFSDDSFSPERIVSKQISATTRREYRPVDTPSFPSAQNAFFSTTSGSIKTDKLTRNPEKISATILLDSPNTIFVRQFYFPGWELQVDGLTVPLKNNNPNRQMAFSLPEGSHEIQIQYKGTTLIKAGRVISLVALFLLVNIGVISVRSRFRSSPATSRNRKPCSISKLLEKPFRKKVIAVVVLFAAFLLCIWMMQKSKAKSLSDLRIQNLVPIGSLAFTNKNSSGNRLFVDYLNFEKGVQTYGNVSLEYKVPGTYKRFIGWVGLDDSSVKCKRSKPIFASIYFDGNKVFQSQPLFPFQTPQYFDLDITGVESIRLRSSSAASKDNCFYTDWIGGELIPK